ncbi:hypothetical protein TVAG_060350 [Trichomonas vaginalis G3]|uniref:Transmembrane protein n=1 Tax=Trichomonas vaginalis (strain ATCC PRA-98 / G3) TaxID=412133 RepID=A2ECG4_TRIV3|nr:hypothetical protein TVAGG3_0311710 [Trichomonas vaginalis G3]EAY09659.1 hypothetical protein TVAG_060350 [Trichomonas vaginalis G3]KAI5528661.1 hypothetical protein TVAGG3_0311710 [Trichomonas vaginalis G3]|eukprot:XP_001321882.1 hypothetical protein [Trichomonas vaginalis G3]
MGDNRDIISSPNVSFDLNYQVEEKQRHVIIKQFHNINFTSCVAFIDVSTDYADLESVQLQMVSMNSNLLRTCLILIIMFCVLATIMLLFAISKRARPESADQLYSVVLMGFLFLIDGPWLVFCYYNIPIFSTIFDIMIQIFHIIFILYMFIFFNSKSRNVLFNIFSNKILYGFAIALELLLIILQFVSTDGVSLCVVPMMDKNIPLISSTVAIFVIYHVSILILMTYGFIKMQFECIWGLILLIIMFFTLEIINISVFFVRSFIDLKYAGLGCAFDIFYIIEANLVSMFLVFINTPIIKKLPPQVYAYYRNRLSYSEP